MNRLVTSSVVALAVAMALPTTLATWYGYSSQEPDNRFDATGQYMFLDPPTGASQVYFNVVDTFEGGLSFNSATLGGRVEPSPSMTFVGFLGVWVDCNHDGYIGMADAALREYRAEASAAAGHRIDTTICPVVDETKAANQGQVHNDGSWITELIPIGTTPPKLDPRYLPDPGAMMWGDHGAPVTPASDPAPNSCAQTTYTLAPGESRHTGGILHHADCLDGNAPENAYGFAVAVDPTGLVAGNVPDPQALYEGGPLDKPTFGDDSSQESFVTGAQDCSQAPLVPFAPLNATLASSWPASTAPYPLTVGDRQGVRSPGGVHANPNGDIPGTLNETHEEEPGLSTPYASVGDDCNASDDSGNDFYGPLEGGSEVAADHKTSAQMNFRFARFNNRYGCTGVSRNVCGMANDLGAPEAMNYVALENGDYWSPGTSYVPTTPDLVGGTGVNRASLGATTDVSPADFWTFYAAVDLAGLSTPGTGTYGQEFCTDGIGTNAPVQHGWDCDPADWADAAVGQVFQLRDVDCYDNALVSAQSSVNPARADVGPRSATAATQASHGCW